MGTFFGAVKLLLLKPNDPIDSVQFLLTFRPFVDLPADVQEAYLVGRLHLLPFPGSLVFWGMKRYRKLQQQLPFALQIPLLHLFERQESPQGIRVPQSGWLHEGEVPSSQSLTQHPAGPPERSCSRNGRTSIDPSRAGGILDAMRMASLRSVASIR